MPKVPLNPFVEHIRACYWRHGATFVGPDFLKRNSIPFTVCVQEPGDVVLIGGSTLYESFDEGCSVVITVPYLDQNSNDIIHDEGLIPLDECSCRSTPVRDRIVWKRGLVLCAALDRTDTMDTDMIGETMPSANELVISTHPSTKPMEPDCEPEDETPPKPSHPRHHVTLAMDGPNAEEVVGKMEPDGPLILTGERVRAIRHSPLTNGRICGKGHHNREFGSPCVIFR